MLYYKPNIPIAVVEAKDNTHTYTAFQIIWRLWKSGTKKRILYLADRENLIDQTKRGDFKYFGDSIFTYSLKQGIDDGFLASYKVLKIVLDVILWYTIFIKRKQEAYNEFGYIKKN